MHELYTRGVYVCELRFLSCCSIPFSFFLFKILIILVNLCSMYHVLHRRVPTTKEK
jgi:hypothetical protein